MEETASWKAHSFTLMVFAGIVVLCSIFFILGMLVGRNQGQKMALAAAGSAASKLEAKAAPEPERKPELTFYESVENKDTPALEAPAQPDAKPVSKPEVKI